MRLLRYAICIFFLFFLSILQFSFRSSSHGMPTKKKKKKENQWAKIFLSKAKGMTTRRWRTRHKTNVPSCSFAINIKMQMRRGRRGWRNEGAEGRGMRGRDRKPARRQRRCTWIVFEHNMSNKDEQEYDIDLILTVKLLYWAIVDWNLINVHRNCLTRCSRAITCNAYSYYITNQTALRYVIRAWRYVMSCWTYCESNITWVI